MADQYLAARLRMTANQRSNRQIAQDLGLNGESVRRYMAGITQPSAIFLAAFCKTYGVHGTWLLTGEGPRNEEEMADKQLTQARIGQVLESLADRLQDLENRLDSVETSCRSMRRHIESVQEH